ncbi:amidohydrolase [Saccharothrix sp. S26]|uniref:amidohydrolase family protein n=1 Tax=Saccharothrix sp. S26 TaxID=2907215 RepID=UPI001F1B881E|nr:amidohydrolase family protein [Saccharothrix sp. S26]MCE6996356.1 amidohydrolase [Saccharothrix sp. S26]
MARVSRRGVLAAGLLAVTVPPGGDASDRRVDVHHHCTPPGWLRWAQERGVVGEPPWWARWDVTSTLAVMDRFGIETAVMSVTMPEARYRDAAQFREGHHVAYQAVADLVAAHPGRFAFLARTTGAADPDLAIWSAVTGLEAGAVGVQAPTHDRRDAYVGEPSLDPLLAELDARRTVLVLHPTDLPGGQPDQPTVPGVPNFLCDYALDTTRAAVCMIVHRTLDRFPRLSVVLPHGGGALPYLAARAEALGGRLEPPVPAARVRDYLRRFHYDTAAPMSPHATPTLLAVVDPTRLHYGSDWPAMSADEVGRAAAALDSDPALPGALRPAVNRHNALRLFPGLARP